MPIKTVLFDLDGTLLPLDQEQFVGSYFGLLAKKAAPLGYEPQDLIRSIWSGTKAMIANDGAQTNEAVFWQTFAARYGEEALAHKPVFDAFYANEFQQVKAVCGFRRESAEVIALLKSFGCRVALATNPIFPAVATQSRIRWAGLVPEDFELVTTYENSCRCKPNPDYYRDVLCAIGADAADCLMVGNDVKEDMVAETLGMQVFLLTDCLINQENADISRYPHGSFPELLAFLQRVCRPE